ncbi:MAG: hypothetical protein IKB88_11855 [Clostridia bacterium]|nr:hypothetical protein [Clostridia bacterium]
MPMVPFTDDTQNIDELIQTKAGEIESYDTDIVKDLTSMGTAHQPFIVAIDASGSMTSDAGNGKSKLELCEELVNSLPQSEQVKKLTPVEMGAVDSMVLSFSGDEVLIHSKWMPLSIFEGISKIKPGTTTPLYKVICESIQASRVLRAQCSQEGIECRRPQIFIYTDGLATDSENRAEAKRLCEKYAEGEISKVKIFVVLVPGSMSDADINKVTSDILDLSDTITVMKAVDCVNGLPATFDFLASSVVVGASSAVGDVMNVKFDPSYIKVAGNTAVTTTGNGQGTMITGKQISWSK